jgi:alpha-beta hydrolase superfamily lysophospholipase
MQADSSDQEPAAIERRLPARRGKRGRRPDPALIGEARTRAVYLHTEPDPTFAVLHAAASPPVAGTTGVVICPTFAWEEICTHRVRRAWADALAHAGHPTVRFDLPGTGDSGGSGRSCDRLGAWVASVGAAATWLRHEAGCARVCAIGIGFGGILAWLAAAGDAPVDDLVLWAVPSSGRLLVRQARAAAGLHVDSHLHSQPTQRAGTPDPIPFEAGDLLDQGGQVTTRQTLESLAAVELRNVALPHPELRHILLLARPGLEADQAMADHLRATGADVTVADAEGHGELMRYADYGFFAQEVIGTAQRWLARAAGERGHAIPAVTPATTSIAIGQDGVVVVEEPVSYALPSGPVSGVITRPVDAPTTRLCVVFFSGGWNRRIGPNRIWVSLARRWAARGVIAIRIDPPGIGESDGDERAWAGPESHFDRANVGFAVELLDAVERAGGPSRFVIAGFCSGAYRSFHLAMRDRRVAGVFAIGLPFLRWTWWTVHVRDSELMRRLRTWDPEARKRGPRRLRRRALIMVTAARRAVTWLRALVPARADRTIADLAAQGTELLFILKRSAYAAELLQAPRRRRRLQRSGRVRVAVLPGDDELFRPLASQRMVIDAMDDALTRVIWRETVDAQARQELAAWAEAGGRLVAAARLAALEAGVADESGGAVLSRRPRRLRDDGSRHHGLRRGRPVP